MIVTRIPRALARGYIAFVNRLASGRPNPNLADHCVAGFILLMVFTILWVLAASVFETYQFDHLSAAEHLAKAKQVCGPNPVCADAQTALKNLHAISPGTDVSPEAAKLVAQINLQTSEDKETREGIARQRMMRNFNGEANDSFECGQSAKDNQDIVSFDDGQTWWKDDGRCAVRVQKKRDEDALLHSYWSTTVRVDTDMNASWLPDEERECQTYPDLNGKVSTVRCTSSNEGATHNIPVEFWGGVDRNTVSNWKCRREKGLLDDRFVCRAID